MRVGNRFLVAGLAGPWLAALALLVCCAPLAKGADDRIQVGERLVIGVGEEAGDAVCIFCSLVIDGEVRGDAVSIGGSVESMGNVGGDVVAVGGPVVLGGRVGGDVVSVGADVELRPEARVGGGVTVLFGQVTGYKQAGVRGQVISVRAMMPMVASGLAIFGGVLLLMLMFFQPLLALLCAAIMGRTRVQVLADTARSRAGMSFLAGVALIAISGLLAVLSVAAPFWIPGIFFPFCVLLLVLLVGGYTGISYWVGRAMASRTTLLTATVLGALLVTIIQWIPVIGWLVGCIFFMMALGAGLLSGLGTSVDWLRDQTARTQTAE